MSNDKPFYYVRVRIQGVWYVLWRVKHNRTSKKMEPIWWKESELGNSTPYLYHTQTGARNAIDNYGSENDTIEIVVWDEEQETDAKIAN